MIEVTNINGSIISFDGRIIEVFLNKDSRRFHVKQIISIDIKQSRRGYLEIHGRVKLTFFMLHKIDPDQKEVVEEFVAQVKAAMV